MLRKSSSYEKNLAQLELLSPSGELWLDAGCGGGAYTLPLTAFVTRVIAMDRDPNALNELRDRITPELKARIEIRAGDIYVVEYPHNLDGVLFAFSLHYSGKNETALKMARSALRPDGGEIVIIDYCSPIPKPWMPRPFTPGKAERLLQKVGLEVETVFRNERFYIMRGAI